MNRARLALMLTAVVIAVAACGGGGASGAVTGPPSAATAPSGDPTKDKLALVMARGTLVLSTDPDYAPQSFVVKGATRASSTTCAPNEMTAPEVSGYDTETGKLVAAELGLEPCFVTEPWAQIIAGGWGDRWDVAWGSGALTASRMKVLYMTQPYYTTPANYFVRTDSTYQVATDLAGKQVGACAGCTHEQYLRGTLTLPGETLTYPVKDPKIVTFASEVPGLQALQDGKIDAFLCSQPVGAAAIADGAPLRMLKEPAFTTEKVGYADRGSTLAPGPFLDRIDAAVAALHQSGKLAAMSKQWFGVDFATAAGTFDLGSVGQQVP